MNKTRILRGLTVITLAASSMLLTGCATNMHAMQQVPSKPTGKLSGYDAVYLHKSTIAPTYAGSGGNQKAVKKIDEHLEKHVREIYGDVKVIGTDASVSADEGKNALVIKPYVEEIKWVGGAARFWVGAMAGSSAINLRVTFSEAGSGDVVGDPIFYKSASAYAGGFGVADNAMLAQIAADVRYYIQAAQ